MRSSHAIAIMLMLAAVASCAAQLDVPGILDNLGLVRAVVFVNTLLCEESTAMCFWDIILKMGRRSALEMKCPSIF